jgi:predicted transcriptional regulator
VTVKDELHALVDRLPDPDAHEALEYLRARIERASRPDQAFIDECRRALDEAVAPDAAWVPHETVRAWLQTWGTPEEGAADAAVQALEERGRQGPRGAGGE